MYIYLLHMPILFIWQKNVHLDNAVLGSLLIFAIAAAFGALVMIVRETIQKAYRSRLCT